MSAALHGLRVLELANGVAGPYAGRLLAMLGATVVKAEPRGGDPARRLAVDHRPTRRPSPVFVHLNAGKRLVARDRIGLPAALEWADVVLDDGFLDDGFLDDGFLAAAEPRGALVVTVTPGTPHREELLVQAASGLLGVSVDDQGRPLRFPGWQSQYLAGAYAAALALAGLATGAGRADVSWLAALLSGFEAHAAADLYTVTSTRPDDPSERSGNAGHLSRTYPSGVFRCADGYVIPGTVRAEDWVRQCEVYGRPELVYDQRFVWANRWANRHLLGEELRPWYRAQRRRELFQVALDTGWAVGLVMTASDALTDPHLRERGFLTEVGGATAALIPARPWRSDETDGAATAAGPVRLSAPDGDRDWFDPAHARGASVPRPPDPGRLRVVELTLAWAGPLTGRYLGALGADVVRVEVGHRPDGWRTRRRWRELGVPVPDGVDPEHYTWDASAQFNSLNRAKRAVSVDLATAAGADVFRALVTAADVLIVNMSPDVLDKRGVADHVRCRLRRGLVVLTMPALGCTGRYSSMAGYGMLTEGMGGFAARFGPATEHAYASTTYYPDAVAGVHGVVAVLAALAGRARHGRGDWIDLSQQETLWMQLGEGLVLASREGREPARLGNAEPGVPGSGVVAAADGHVAYVDRRGGVGSPECCAAAGQSRRQLAAALRAAGALAEPIRDLRDGYHSGELLAQGLVELVDHPVVGRRGYVALPGHLDGRALTCARPAPMFDQHTDEVLGEWLGLGPGRIAELRAAEAVGTRPRQPRRLRTAQPR